MPATAIEASGLTKVYRVYPRPLDRLWAACGGRPRHSEVRALDDVGFAVPAGEGLGIVGENGAGKSTLLKILSGVTQPTRGSFRLGGRVAAILELGAGFHPEFTGRQNAVLNAALLGLSPQETQAALPRILDFSELGDFLERPVKTYSTGMVMRLAFSIATQVDPELLIVDEALSVGDGYFQKKCIDRLLGFIRAGGTVLFCSHAMYYVTSLCRHALWLRQGRVERFGNALEVVRAYEEHLAEREARGRARREAPAGDAGAEEPGRARPARITAVRWRGSEEPVVTGGRTFAPGAAWGIAIEWESDDARRPFQLGIGLDRADGVQVASFATHQDGLEPLRGGGRCELALDELPLQGGEFALYVFLLDGEGLHVYDQQVVHGAFRVEGSEYRIGLVRMAHEWPHHPARERRVRVERVARLAQESAR